MPERNFPMMHRTTHGQKPVRGKTSRRASSASNGRLCTAFIRLGLLALLAAMHCECSAQKKHTGEVQPGDNVEAAISHYSAILRQNPRDSAAYKHLSSAYRFAGMLEQCVSVLKQVHAMHAWLYIHAYIHAYIYT